MKKNLFIYFVFAILDFLVIAISLKYTIKSVVEIDYIGCILWSLIFSLELDRFITRHRNFVKYYPNFEDKWLDL